MSSPLIPGFDSTQITAALAVADDDQGGEAEATAALDDLRDTVGRDDALEQRVLLDGSVATTCLSPAVGWAALN